MARTFHRKETLGAMSEINVTPLIDLAFALLIIFMITTPLMENKVRVDLPEESQSRPPPTEERFENISINRRGQHFWGDDPVTLGELEERLQLVALQADPPVLSIRGDARIAYQEVITVLDLIKKHNLSKISLDTRVEQ